MLYIYLNRLHFFSFFMHFKLYKRMSIVIVATGNKQFLLYSKATITCLTGIDCRKDIAKAANSHMRLITFSLSSF